MSPDPFGEEPQRPQKPRPKPAHPGDPGRPTPSPSTPPPGQPTPAPRPQEPSPRPRAKTSAPDPKAKMRPKDEPSGELPFAVDSPASTRPAVARYTAPSRDYTPWIVAAVVGALLAAGGFFFGKDLISPASARATAKGDLFRNVGRNYSFQAPDAAWKADATRAQIGRAHV